MSFNVTPFNDRVLCDYASSRHNTREQLVRDFFFEGLQNYAENKSDGNKNKRRLEEFDFTRDKMDRDGGNRTQRLCFENLIPAMPRQNSLWIMGTRETIEKKETRPILVCPLQ